MTVQYSLQDYINIAFKTNDYKLPESVTQTINNLIKELGINTTISRFDSKPTSFNKTTNNVKRTKSGTRMNEDTDEHWNRMKEFKATKMDKKEGVDKIISDIRSCLNKISEKSYQSQLKDIQSLIQSALSCQSTDDESSEEETETKDNSIGVDKIASIILDVACSNKMNSVLYANLFKELIALFPQFNDIINNIIPNYLNSITDIKYVNHETDYDAFCEYNKINDKRKALVVFIVNLMNIEVLQKGDIKIIITTIQKMIIEMINQDNKTNEVDEITENLYLYVTMTKGDVLSNDKWKTILDDVKMVSGYKSKDYKSLSNRAVFKHMDILDFLMK